MSAQSEARVQELYKYVMSQEGPQTIKSTADALHRVNNGTFSNDLSKARDRALRDGNYITFCVRTPGIDQAQFWAFHKDAVANNAVLQGLMTADRRRRNQTPRLIRGYRYASKHSPTEDQRFLAELRATQLEQDIVLERKIASMFSRKGYKDPSTMPSFLLEPDAE